MSEWQPIETAPKDGTWLLLAERHPPSRSDLHFNPNAAEFVGVTVGAYARYSGDHFEWHRYGVGLIDGRLLTHWMPLPEPPQ